MSNHDIPRYPMTILKPGFIAPEDQILGSADFTCCHIPAAIEVRNCAIVCAIHVLVAVGIVRLLTGPLQVLLHVDAICSRPDAWHVGHVDTF